MIKNMGSSDKSIRVIIAFTIAVLYFMNVITGTIAIVALILAIVFLATSFIGFCPLYYPFGFNTCSKKENT
ncbi:MAG: DUF2892 domain-containing protein [Saprospiraceae bacterium]|nr:DUF2892 domain-containing protein [Saprospiraceae bacterium]